MYQFDFSKSPTELSLLRAQHMGMVPTLPANTNDTLNPIVLSPDGTVEAGFDLTSHRLYLNVGGNITQLDSFGPTGVTAIEGVNDQGVIVGTADIGGLVQGFSAQNGHLTAIRMPGSALQGYAGVGSGPQSAALPPLNSTHPSGINDAGEIVGSFISSADGQMHGFTDIAGVFEQFDVPVGTDNAIWGVQADGTVYGAYVVGDTSLGFMASPADLMMSDDLSATTGIKASPYSGPVAGLTREFIDITSHNLNITAITPNLFIHSGSGTDAIDVSGSGGTNVLDGGTGSNFLVGGHGRDTFFADDRNANADIWSTIAGFHSGDAATIWGVRASDFVSVANHEGTGDYMGLTFHVAGPHTASVTLAGMSNADLSSKVSIAYGSVQGNSYMQITGN